MLLSVRTGAQTASSAWLRKVDEKHKSWCSWALARLTISHSSPPPPQYPRPQSRLSHCFDAKRTASPCDCLLPSKAQHPHLATASSSSSPHLPSPASSPDLALPTRFTTNRSGFHKQSFRLNRSRMCPSISPSTLPLCSPQDEARPLGAD